MLRNYLKIAMKVLVRRKFFTAISLFGITFTLTMALAMTSLIDHTLSPGVPEVSLDRTLHLTRFHTRIVSGDSTSTMMGDAGYALLDRHVRGMPGVENMSIYASSGRAVSFVGDRKLEFRIKTTDGAYWEILDFDFLEGGPITEADENSGNFVAVISEATRLQYFGEGRQALGETIETGGQRFRVVGIVRNVDHVRQSALADIWVPHSTRKSQEFRHSYRAGGFSAILLARSSDDFPAIKAEYAARLEHVPCPEEYDELTVKGTACTRLEELAGWSGDDEGISGGGVHLMIWGYVGGLFLWMLLPTLNLISLNMSRIIERSSEIGVRKAFGASSFHLVGQFVLENVLLCLIGGLLSLFGAMAVLRLVEASGVVPFSHIALNYRIFFYSVALAVLFGVLSGALPAWRMSRMHPVQALRGGAR